jgi:endonuclease/exonuclease/phosphatase family metal-dependent hydrolase
VDAFSGDPTVFSLPLFVMAILTQQPPVSTQPAEVRRIDVPQTQFAPDEGLQRIAWHDARSHMGEEVVVVGRLIHSSTNAGGVSLFFDRPRNRALKVFIRTGALDRFPTAPDSAYPGHWVAVRGLIDDFRGEPQIVIGSPDRISILPEEPRGLTAATQPALQGGVVRIACYNLLNLFDTFDDPYTHDEDTPFKPREEMEKTAARIRELNADVLAVVEVENRGILERFNRVLLADMGYHEVVLVEGNDGRGIDCALLSRLPVGAVTSYRHLQFPLPGGGQMRFRRDLLRARIEPPGAPPFDVLVVHLKSKRGEATGSAPIRLGEATQVRVICDEILRRDADARFVVCGDFNDTWDSPALAAIRGSGANALACFITDVPEEGRISYNREPYQSMIDYILCSPAMAFCYVPKSYRIPQGTVESSGSDHNPVVADFRLR